MLQVEKASMSNEAKQMLQGRTTEKGKGKEQKQKGKPWKREKRKSWKRKKRKTWKKGRGKNGLVQLGSEFPD